MTTSAAGLNRTGVEAEFAPHTGGRRVPVQVEQELWRILQESLTNVERHADASHAWISWRIGDGRAQLEVRDDGRGMNTDAVARERYGLVGIRERADAVGAHVTLPSEPESGTTVLVELEVAAMTRVLIADDHQLLRQALRRALEDSGFEVVAEAGDGEEAVRLVDAAPPGRRGHGRDDAGARWHRGDPSHPRRPPVTRRCSC